MISVRNKTAFIRITTWLLGCGDSVRRCLSRPLACWIDATLRAKRERQFLQFLAVALGIFTFCFTHVFPQFWSFFFSNFYPELKLSRNLGFMRKEHFCFIRWMNVTDLSFFKYFYVSSGLKGECFQARQMGVKRVLIVDWDVHAGQGTQYCIDDDENIRLISMHRYEYGKFWPQLPESAVKHSCQ